jgi:hypothetical protein
VAHICTERRVSTRIQRRAPHKPSRHISAPHSEPAGQIAARKMEIVRIKGALQRAEELSDDLATTIERAL